MTTYEVVEALHKPKTGKATGRAGNAEKYVKAWCCSISNAI